MNKNFMVRDGDYLAVFNSAHRVMKAEQVLKSLQIPILLIPAPRQMQTDCGLALRFEKEICGQVMDALGKEQLSPAFLVCFIGGNYQKVDFEPAVTVAS